MNDNCKYDNACTFRITTTAAAAAAAAAATTTTTTTTTATTTTNEIRRTDFPEVVQAATGLIVLTPTINEHPAYAHYCLDNYEILY